MGWQDTGWQGLLYCWRLIGARVRHAVRLPRRRPAGAVHFTRKAGWAPVLAAVPAGGAAGWQQRPADHATGVQPQQPHALTAAQGLLRGFYRAGGRARLAANRGPGARELRLAQRAAGAGVLALRAPRWIDLVWRDQPNLR